MLNNVFKNECIKLTLFYEMTTKFSNGPQILQNDGM